MTKPRNRADRIFRRRKGALERLPDYKVDEKAILLKRMATPPQKKFTRKSKNFGEWTEARKMHQSGKIAR